MQGTHKTGIPELRVQLIRFFQSFRVKRDDGVDAGTLFIVRVNPVQITLDQLVSRQLSRFISSMNFVDGRLHDLKRRLATLSMTGRPTKQPRESREQFVVFHACQYTPVPNIRFPVDFRIEAITIPSRAEA
jgi:hypothetical protein